MRIFFVAIKMATNPGIFVFWKIEEKSHLVTLKFYKSGIKVLKAIIFLNLWQLYVFTHTISTLNTAISIFVSQYVAMFPTLCPGNMSEIYINFKLISNFYRTSIFYSQLCYLYYVSQPYIFIFTDLQHVSNPPGLVSGTVLGGSPAAGGGSHFHTGGAVSGGMSAGADPGGPGSPLTTKNEAPAPKFYKIEATEWQF